MYKHTYFYLLFAGICGLTSCSSKGDYSAPFYKTFDLVYGKDTTVLYLQRTIEQSAEHDSIAYNIYSGKIMLPEAGGYIGNISGSVHKGDNKIRLTFDIGKKDTLGFLNLTINGDGSKLEGWKGLQAASKALPDSVRVKAKMQENKDTKVNFGLKPKVITKEYHNAHFGGGADYDMNTDTIPQVDTVMELDIIRGNMDSTAFQRMISDVKQHEQSGDLSLQFVSGNFLSLERFLWEEGGVHALYYWYYYSYDLNTGKQLKLLDVFQSYTLSDVASAINKNLKKQLGLRSGQSLKEKGYNHDYIGVSKNFFVTDKGIGFQYNIYEIASFAGDATTVFVPFKDVQEYLNPEFSALIFKEADKQHQPESKAASGGSAKFVGKWIHVDDINKHQAENEYLVIKRDGEKFRLLSYINDRLVENSPDGFLYYNKEKDILTRTAEGYTTTITFDNKKKTITWSIPASRYDKAMDLEFAKVL